MSLRKKTRLETERLILREFKVDDAEAVLRFGSDAEVSRYTGDAELMLDVDDALKVIRDTWHTDYATHGYGRLAIELKSNHNWGGIDVPTGQVIGFCGLKFLPEFEQADLGYRMLPQFWGQGIATESSRAVLDNRPDSLVDQPILGITMVENVASQRVLQKLGFEQTERTTLDGQDVFMFVLPA